MYNVICYPTMERFAERLQKEHPGLFTRIPVKWSKFSDSGMDHIIVDGFRPTNIIKRSRVIFLADFNSNDAIMSQLHILVMLCESFIEDLIIYLPYLPVATMERIVHEGEVATANTICRILSHLPPFGRPARVMFYDLHTLQNRFYLHTNALASMHSAVPLIIDAVMNGDLGKIDAVAFPDEGAQKRFGKMFQSLTQGRLIVCGKKRVGDTRKVFIQDGDCEGKRILIVDDIVKTGGTLAECAKTLKKAGAKEICAYCTYCSSAKRENFNSIR